MINLHLDVGKHDQINPAVMLRRGDGLIDTLHVLVTDDGQPFDLAGYTLSFEGLTAAGTKIMDDSVKATAVGELDYTLPVKAAGAVGQFKRAYFSFVKGAGRTTTGNFNLFVIDEVDLSADEATDYLSQYDKLKANLQAEYDATVKQLTKNISDLTMSAGAVTNSAAHYATSTADNAVAYSKSQTNSAVSAAKVQTDSAIADTRSQTASAASQAISTANSAGTYAKTTADSAANYATKTADSAVSAAGSQVTSAVSDVKSQTASASAYVQSAADSSHDVAVSAANASLSYAENTNAIAQHNADVSNSLAATGQFVTLDTYGDNRTADTAAANKYADSMGTKVLNQANAYTDIRVTDLDWQKTPITDMTGSYEVGLRISDGIDLYTKIESLPLGFHTMYVQANVVNNPANSQSIRGYFHVTDKTTTLLSGTGHFIANDGKSYDLMDDNGTWHVREIAGTDCGQFGVLSPFVRYRSTSTDYAIEYSRVGNSLTLNGEVGVSAVTKTIGEVKMFQIPPFIGIPTVNGFSLNQGSGALRWFLRVGTDGIGYISRSILNSGDDTFLDLQPGTWLPFSITVIVK